MISILKKEINTFFTSSIGYLVVALFFVLTGLFLWVFDSQYNIFNYGYADLSPFFQLCSRIFIFLIPAITMRSISDELRSGTLELLFTKPLSEFALVLGKFFGALLLILIALLPTLGYIIAIDSLGNPPGNYDAGILVGSYIGLFFLATTYTAIGIFASSLTTNQIVAFLIAVLISSIFYYAFDTLSFLEFLSLRTHFDSISRGVLDTRDLLYFFSLSLLFLYFTSIRLKNHR